MSGEDYDNVIKECCDSLSTCTNFSSPAFQKDVYDPEYYSGPAIALTLLAIIIFGIILLAFKNLKEIYSVRKGMSIRNTLLMNLLILFALIALFVYCLDGIFRLSGYFGYNPIGILVMQILGVGFFLCTLAYASYSWTKLICISNGKWGDNLITKSINIFFLVNIGFIVIMILTNLVMLLSDYSEALSITFLLLSIAAFVNGIAFSFSCYTLATHLKEIYNFDSRKQTKVKVLRVFAIMIAFFSFMRVVNGLYSHFNSEWQTRLKINSYCNKEPTSSLYIFFYLTFTSVLPELLFLFVFTPSTPEKTGSSQNVGDWPQYGIDDSLDDAFVP